MTETYVVTGTGTAAKATIVKDPDAVLDYVFDWTDWAADITDTLASAVVTVPTGIVLDSSVIVAQTVVAWVSGGTVGTTYRVVCHITTTGGRQDDRSIYIKIKER